jgi:hypothetical protein
MRDALIRRSLSVTAIGALVVVLLTLANCGTLPETPLAPQVAMPLATPVGTSAQATLEAALTLEMNNAGDQAVATAEIMRSNALATMDSANATLYAAQTQDQNNSNVIAAQIAATAEVARANALATLNAAGSTQSAGLTQDAIQQTEVQFSIQMTADLATQNALATATQQNSNILAAGTQTAIANNIATQTQVAAATSQWYVDQDRQRKERIQGPLAFLLIWCLPAFIIVVAGLVLWGYWRWVKIQQNRQRIAEKLIDKPHLLVGPNEPQDSLPPPGSDITSVQYQITKPDKQIRGWLEEIKRKLLERGKDDNDNPDS